MSLKVVLVAAPPGSFDTLVEVVRRDADRRQPRLRREEPGTALAKVVRCVRGRRCATNGSTKRVGGEPDASGGRACVGVEDLGRLLTAAEVAQRLGYTERYVWQLGRDGVLPRINLPGRKYVRFAERDVDRFVTRHRRDAFAPPRPVAARHF